jgi:N-acetylneuraminic acid mutarotase
MKKVYLLKETLLRLTRQGFLFLVLTALAGNFSAHASDLSAVAGATGATFQPAASCSPISTLSCDQLQVSLPYRLSFSGGVAGTMADKNGVGTGFTMVSAYSGTRNSADGSPSNSSVPGYEPSKLTIGSGVLKLVTNKGIASTTTNNQLNTLGVKVDSRGKLLVEVTMIKPFYGTAYQQGGVWLALHDKTFVKLVVVSDKVELRREVNDVSGSSDGRITGSVSGINNQNVRLRLVVDPSTNTAQGFYSINGGSFVSVGTALSISGMGLTGSTAYASLYATHRNGSTAVTYTFDDFSVSQVSTSGNNPPVFATKNYTYSISEEAAVGAAVGSVKATDPNGDAIKYSFSAGNTNSAFAINTTTGAITVAKKLNHHTQANYSITVRAADGGGLYDVATVAITVNAGTSVPTFSSINWGTAAAQQYAVNEVQGEVVNGKLYTFGGYYVNPTTGAWTPTERAYVYDPVANTWTRIASMPPMNGTNYGGVTHAGFATDGTDIYFAGGYTANATGTGQIFGTREAWKYIVAENRYVRLPDLPRIISSGQLEYLNGKLYHIGGHNQSRTTDLGDHYVLDLDNLAAGWKTLAALPNPSNHAGSTVYNGKIYYVGGQHRYDGNSVTQKSLHIYNPGTNSWTKGADMPVPSGTSGRSHISGSVFVMGNRIMVLGGDTSHGTNCNLVSAYTPSTNSWANLTPLPVKIRGGVAATLIGNLYYTGGSNSKATYKGVPPQTVISPVADDNHRLNAGGSQFVDSKGQTWGSDAYFTGGTTGSKSFDVAGTTDDALYLKYRYASSKAPFSYNIPVSGSGPFTVRLHFLEPYFGAPGGKTTGLTGARVFHVDLEGQRVLSNYDIYTQDGAGKAVVKTFDNVSVADGALTVAFTSVNDNAIISAIEVVSLSQTSTSSASVPEEEGTGLLGGVSLRLYPNPIQEGGQVFLDMENLGRHEAVQVILRDLLGRLVKSTTVQADEQGHLQTELSSDNPLSRGIYLIEARSAAGKAQGKLLVR